MWSRTGSSARADFFISDYIAPGTTASVSNNYGQVTLPILSIQEKLVATDSEGQIWIPEDSKIYYTYKSSEAYAPYGPDDSDYTEDPDARYALDGKLTTLWFREDEGTPTDYIWIRAAVPPNANAAADANAVILHPFPEFGLDLYELSYRTASRRSGWQAADLSYLSGWDGVAVRSAGKCRVWLPLSQVTEIRLKAKAHGGYWGLGRVSLPELDMVDAASAASTISRDENSAHGQPTGPDSGRMLTNARRSQPVRATFTEGDERSIRLPDL